MMTPAFGTGIANFNANSMERLSRFLELDLQLLLPTVSYEFHAFSTRPLESRVHNMKIQKYSWRLESVDGRVGCLIEKQELARCKLGICHATYATLYCSIGIRQLPS